MLESNQNKADNDRWMRWVIVLTFLAILAIGVISYDDYGISVDESFQIKKARVNWDYIAGTSDELLSYDDRHYGAIIAMQLEAIGGNIKDSRVNFLARHLYTYLTFYLSSIYLFALLRKMKMAFGVALAGVLLYVFHPHIFSHSFYNIKDIPFLSYFVMSLYSLALLIEKRDWKFALLHGTLSGYLVVLRLPGVMMWGLTGLAALALLAREPRKWKLFSVLALVYGVAALGALVLFMPALWHNPYIELRLFLSMDLFTWPHKELFMGNFLSPEQYPWYYLPVYFAVTTPILFLAFFGVGIIAVFTGGRENRNRPFEANLVRWIMVAAFVLPLLVLMAIKPVIYNGWRHAFFIYAGFVGVAAIGVELALNLAIKWWKSRVGKPVILATLLLVLLAIAKLGLFFYFAHPFEHVYYNKLAGSDLAAARTAYAMDYWGLAYRTALEKIAESDPRTEIRVTGFHPYLAQENWKILPKPDRKRILVVGKDEPFDYLIDHYRTHFNTEVEGLTLVDSIWVDGAIINGTYKRK